MGFNFGGFLKAALPVAASFIPGIGPVAGPIAGALLNSGGGGRGPAQQRSGGLHGMTNMLQDRMNRAEEDARGSRNSYMDAIGAYGSFDPSSFIRDQAGFAFKGIGDQFDKRFMAEQEARNSAGMLRSGVGQADFRTDFNNSLANALAGISMQAGQMRQNQLGGVAGMRGNVYGGDANRANSYMDGMLGLQGAGMQQDAMNQASKRDMWGNLLGGVIGAAGTIGGAYLNRGGGSGGNRQVNTPFGFPQYGQDD